MSRGSAIIRSAWALWLGAAAVGCTGSSPGTQTATAEKWVNEDETGKQNELWRNIGGRFVNVTDRID